MTSETINVNQTPTLPKEASRETKEFRSPLSRTSLHDQELYQDGPHSLKKPRFNTRDANSPMILHVDDDVDLVDAMTSRFRVNGFRVSCALDGMSGVQSALTHKTDAIILDYDMPNGRGDVVIELLKRNERTKNIPIVVLTAIPTKSLENELLSKGADVFMSKPFQFDELRATVERLIEGN